MFSKFELTNNGVQLLNRVIAESKTLKFTKFQIGKGEFSGDKKTLTQLVSKFDEFNVTEKNVLPDNITNIKGFYDNRNVSAASKFTEIGLMAQLGDDSLTEVLFSYANQPTDEAETIPAKESYFSRTFSIMNRTDNVTSITFDLKIRQDKYNFGTLAELKAADYLDIGDKVTLWGNAALGDTAVKMYIITDQAQEIQLNNLLYAKEYFKIVNNLTDGGADKALSAEMGKELNEKGYKASGNGTFRILNSAFKDVKHSGFYLVSQDSGTIDLPDNIQYGYGIHTQYDRGVGGLQMLANGAINPNKPIAIYVRGAIYNSTAQEPNYNYWDMIMTMNNKYYLGNIGIAEVIYIQDTGIKEKDKGYIDKETGKVYIAIETNEDTTVTEKFKSADNISNSQLVKTLYQATGSQEDGIDEFTVETAYRNSQLLVSVYTYLVGAFRGITTYLINTNLTDGEYGTYMRKATSNDGQYNFLEYKDGVLKKSSVATVSEFKIVSVVALG